MALTLGSNNPRKLIAAAEARARQQAALSASLALAAASGEVAAVSASSIGLGSVQNVQTLYAVSTIATDADASTDILATQSRLQIFHTGTLTADRVLSLGTANAQTGSAIRVTRTGSGAFNLSVAGFKNLATNEWCEVVYDGSAFVLSAYGAL